MRRVYLEGMAQPHEARREPRFIRERLVDEIAGQHRMGLLYGVGGGQVVVLTGIDDDIGPGVDHPGKILVDERAVGIDVAKNNSVHRVVEKHIQPFEGRGRRDLRHAEARGVVDEINIAALPHDRFVQCAPHDPEVFLRGVGSAEALGGRTVGDIVKEALRGGADNGDAVCPV